jgi:chromosome segregation ATPase
MATLDEGVVNLQRFVGLLASATSATQQVGDHVKEAAGHFAQLETEAEQEGGGLNDELTELGQALETEEAEALSAMTELQQAATEAQGKADEAQDKVEKAATDLDEKAGAVESGLEQASEQLTNEGFQPLTQALDEAQQEMEKESNEEEQAFTELESAVGTFESEAETAWNEAEAELEEATGELNEGETQLETESKEGVQGFETAADKLESDCTDLEQDVDAIYSELSTGVEAQGQAWQQAVQAASQEALTFTNEARQQQLDQPAALVKDEALSTLTQEYEALNTVLEAATIAVNGLEPLAEDLVKSQGVLGEIDSLMAALA